MLSGNIQEAIDRWTTTVENSDSNSQAVNDLAVAYLSRGVFEQDHLDLLRALEILEESGAQTPEMLFNRALALSLLHLRSLATEAWRQLLNIEKSTEWSDLARWHLERLGQNDLEDQWPELKKNLTNPDKANSSVVSRAIRDYPFETRALAENTLLSNASLAASAGDLATAAAWIEPAREIAQAFADQKKDYFLLDEIARFQNLLSSAPPPEIRRASEGIQCYLRGLDHYRSRNLSSAESMLRSCLHDLLRAESPLAYAAALYAGISRYYQDGEGALREISSLAATTPNRYPELLGRIHWMIGIIESSQNRFVEAENSFLTASRLIEAVLGRNRAAILELMRADNFDRRGEVGRSWRHRSQALGRLAYHHDSQRHYNALIEASQSLGRNGRTRLALIFLEEAQISLAAYDESFAHAEIAIERAKNLVLIGELEEAIDQLATAEAAIALMEESDFKNRLSFLVKLVEGQIHLPTTPAQALAYLEEAKGFFQETDFQIKETELLVAMAEAKRNLDQPRASISDLAQSIAKLERARRDAEQVFEAVDSFSRARDIFDQLILESLELPEGPREAFAWVERSRSQTALELWAGNEPDRTEVLDFASISDHLPPEATLLVFSVVRGRVICWIVENRTLRLETLEVSARDLAQEIKGFRSSLIDGLDEAEVRRVSARLHGRVIDPLQLDSVPGRSLVISPDGPLRDLPFSALFDPVRGELLTERYLISLAPSATLYILALERAAEIGSLHSALLVGMSETPSGPYENLQDLPSVDTEVAAISAFYPGAFALMDSDATRRKVLEALPRFDIFHFSGHAVTSSRSWDQTALILTPSSGDEGLLRLGDLFAQELPRTRLVTLSACETLRGYDGGREGVFSLSMAFFSAGVPAVVGSMWRIDDESSAAFMKSFYSRIMLGETPASALRFAKLEALREKDRSSTPWGWAAFELIGT